MKRLLCIVLLCAVILGLSSCGSAELPVSPSPNESTAPSESMPIEPSPSENATDSIWKDHCAKGVELMSEGAYEEAVHAFLSAAEVDPSRSEICLHIAQVYQACKNEENLVAAIRQAVETYDIESDLTSTLMSLLEPKEEGTSDNGEDQNIHGEPYTEYVDLGVDGNIKRDYNAEGQLICEIWVDPFGDFMSRTEYEYLPNGKEDRVIEYAADGSVSSYIVYEYDLDNGSLMQVTTLRGDGAMKSYTTYEYGDHGESLRASFFDAENKLVKYRQSYYTADGVLEEIGMYKVDGTPIWIDKYDTKGNCVSNETYNEDGSIRYYVIYKYSESGVKIQASTFRGTDVLLLVADYDLRGTIKRETYYSSSGEKDFSYEFDSEGNLVLETWYNQDGSIQSVYEHDPNGPEPYTVRKDFPDGSYVIYYYDEDGILGSETYYRENETLIKDLRYNKDGALTSKAVYTEEGKLSLTEKYDEKGLLVERKQLYSGSDDFSHFSYTYDNEGRVKFETWRNKDGILLIVEYDSKGNEIDKDFYNRGYPKYSIHTEYDIWGRKIREETYWAKDNLLHEYRLFSYDILTGVVREDVYDVDDGIERITETYEYKDSNVIKETYYHRDGSVWGFYTCEYDDENNCIREYVHGPDGTVFYYIDYVYDSLGNLEEQNIYTSEGELMESISF